MSRPRQRHPGWVNLDGVRARLRTRSGKAVALGGMTVVAVLVLLVARGGNHGWQHITAAVRRGDIRDVVEATGTVNAVVSVQVGSQVSGRIARLNADFNSQVRRGDVIAVIDPSVLQGVLLQASADLEDARASVTAAEANLTKAQAQVDQTKADYERAVSLAKTGDETQQAVDLAKANFEGSQASVEVARAQIAQAKAQVSLKAAAEAVARTNLGHTVIRSPIDGIVVARNVDVGQTVAASLQAPTLFTIAQDLSKMQVYAKVDESDVGRIKVGGEAAFKVDAFPSETFHGVLSQVRMNPTIVQNVVTYDAVIDFANPQHKLFPGMTAYVTVPVATATNVLMLPNAALQYRPPMEPNVVLALYKRYGIEDVEQGRGRSRARNANGDPSHEAGAAATGSSETAVVWKLHLDGTIEPIQVSLGITDHAYTAVLAQLKGHLKEGDELVTRSIGPKTASPLGQGPRR